MLFSHRHSLFSFVVIVLSLFLAGLIYWSTQSEPTNSQSVTQEVETVDSDEYRDSLTQIMATLDERLDGAQDDLDKLLAVQTALSGVLALRVPAEFRDLHLALAVALSDMEKALQSEDRTIDEPLAQILQLRETYPWLAP
ncbi:hypothetical protein HY630_03145 [Candidatus Uhrbacteria bacterium]|nr:hypothetical protein [Candidatus Uhrbacteria bacterium]